jgi:uncharacterized protein (TIGR02246 family)
MNRRQFTIAICGAGGFAMSGVNALAMSVADEHKIRAVLLAYGEAWNRHDMSSMRQLFTDDADWINIVGMHWRGKSAVLTAYDAFWRTIFQKMEITVTDVAIRAIASDIAVAVVALRASEFTTPDGKLRPATQDRLSVILANREGEWRIVHGQNTVVDPTAQPFDPINSDWSTAGNGPTR